MTGSFMLLSTGFQSYQDNERIMIKDCANERHLRLKRFPPVVGIELWIARLAGQLSTHQVTVARRCDDALTS